jgi:hypothetical protein
MLGGTGLTVFVSVLLSGVAFDTKAHKPLHTSPLARATEMVPDNKPLIFAVYVGTGDCWDSGPWTGEKPPGTDRETHPANRAVVENKVMIEYLKAANRYAAGGMELKILQQSRLDGSRDSRSGRCSPCVFDQARQHRPGQLAKCGRHRAAGFGSRRGSVDRRICARFTCRMEK